MPAAPWRRLSMNGPPPTPRGGERAFVPVLSVPLLGGVRGGFRAPRHGKTKGVQPFVSRPETRKAPSALSMRVRLGKSEPDQFGEQRLNPPSEKTPVARV